MTVWKSGAGTALAVALLASAAAGQERGVTYTLSGAPGLLTLPAALTSPKETFALTGSYADPEIGFGFGYQVNDRFWIGSRVTRIDAFDGQEDALASRSFDLRVQLLDEAEGWRPALAIGLDDFLRNGPSSSEYLVASKTLSDSLRLTGGLAWGRLAGDESRAPYTGTQALTDASYFGGDLEVFAGLEYAFGDTFTLKAEYSPDQGPRGEAGAFLVPRESALNLGLVWRPNSLFHLQGGVLGGEAFALSGTLFFSPNKPLAAPKPQKAPVPLLTRALERPSPLSQEALVTALAAEGLQLEGLAQEGSQWRLRYRNVQGPSEAQAMGRIVRLLSRHAPAEVTHFVLEPMSEGLPLSAVRFARSDLEANSNRVGGTQAIAAARDIGFAGGPLPPVSTQNFSWHLGPGLGVLPTPETQGPPDFALDLNAEAQWRFGAGFALEGEARWRLGSTGDGNLPAALPGVERVRSDAALYGSDGVGISRLSLTHWGRPAEDVYSRLSFGLLEDAYAGGSAEVLYKSVSSRWAFGADLHYVQKRAYDMGFDLQDYETATGHLTAYYDFGEGLVARLSAGQYLAGDLGATLALERAFTNGWAVGAYATLTDLDVPDYKDGAFDKGLTFTIPFSAFTGSPTRRAATLDFGVTSIDGGASIAKGRQLYDTLRPGHSDGLDANWGAFWK